MDNGLQNILSQKQDFDSRFKPAPELLPKLEDGKSPGARLQAYRDTEGTLFIHKVHPCSVRLNEENRTHRAFVDVAAYDIGKLMGLSTVVPVRLGWVDGAFGSIMNYIPFDLRIWNRMRVYPSKRSVDLWDLNREHLMALFQEQVLDWMISNHDAHGGHFLITTSDTLFAIDKSQAYKYFPNDALSIHYDPNTVVNGKDNFSYWPVYHILLRSIKSRDASLSLADAWEAVDAVLVRLEAVEEDDLRKCLAAYADYRFNVVKNPDEDITAKQFLDLVVERKAHARRDFEALYNEVDALHRNGGKSRRQADRKEIEDDIRRMETLLGEKGSEQNYEVARMIVPVAAKLRRFLISRGMDEFLNIIEQCYFNYRDPVLKEIVIALMSESANDPLTRKEVIMSEANCPFFAKITLRHFKRVISRIVAETRSTPAGRVIVYQNLRMGGLYPPMEKGMKELLATKGYPVFEIALEDEMPSTPSVDEIYTRMQHMRKGDDFKRAKIILTRFKVSSAPNPEDSEHPEDYRSLASQRDKFVALYALADVKFDKARNVSQQLPILMIDASKNWLSLAQEQVQCSCIQAFNALDLMAVPFYYHHLYWLSAYGMDNVEDLLPASGPGFEDGALYQSFANEAVRMLENDTDYWGSPEVA